MANNCNNNRPEHEILPSVNNLSGQNNQLFVLMNLFVTQFTKTFPGSLMLTTVKICVGHIWYSYQFASQHM